MAKDTSTRVALTQGLVNALKFDQPIIDIDAKGKPVIDPKGLGDKRDWTLRDAGIPGFSVRVYRSKAVYQVVRKMGLRVDGIDAKRSAPIRRVIGDVRTIKLDEARRTAQHWLGQMAQGIDPIRQLRAKALADAANERKENLTFGDHYSLYELDGSGIEPATLKDRQKVSKWMDKSPIWKHPIHDLNASEVIASLQPLFDAAKGKPTEHDWGPKSVGLATAWKIFRHMSAAYTSFVSDLGFEAARGIGPFGTAKKKGGWPLVAPRKTYLELDKDEHVKWLNALYATREHIDPAKQVMADFLLATLILGGRKREVQLLEWEHLDFDKAMGCLPAENRKVDTPHWFPITPWLLEILQQRRQRNSEWGRDGKWVFPSDHHGKALHSYGGLLEHLQDQSGVWLTAHDMRRTAATEVMVITGSEMFVSMTLGHAQGGTDVSMGYVMGRVKLLRPIFEQRERMLRQTLGLEELGEETSPIDAMIEFLREGRDDPAQRAVLEKKVGGMLMLLNS